MLARNRVVNSRGDEKYSDSGCILKDQAECNYISGMRGGKGSNVTIRFLA